jgi:hypothetical protein
LKNFEKLILPMEIFRSSTMDKKIWLFLSYRVLFVRGGQRFFFLDDGEHLEFTTWVPWKKNKVQNGQIGEKWKKIIFVSIDQG